MEIQVNLKSIGERRQSVKPVTYEISGRPSTVRELICAVTETGVEEYNQRMEASGILTYLTREEIDDQAQVGRFPSVSIMERRRRSFHGHRKMRFNALRTEFTGFFWMKNRWKIWMRKFR